MIHRVLPAVDSGYYFQRGTAISRQTFIALLEAVSDRQLPVMVPRSSHLIAKNGVCFSFDDGYADNVWAFEQLLQRGWPSLLFPVRNYSRDQFSAMDDLAAQWEKCVVKPDVNTLRRYRKLARGISAERYRRLRGKLAGLHKDACKSDLFLNEAELAFWSRQGVQLGIHGVTHRIWSALSCSQIEQEMEQSGQWIQSISGKPPVGVAFPHGIEPTCTKARELLVGRPLFGVDREYAESGIIRRLWLKESTPVADVLDSYKRILSE